MLLFVYYFFHLNLWYPSCLNNLFSIFRRSDYEQQRRRYVLGGVVLSGFDAVVARFVDVARGDGRGSRVKIARDCAGSDRKVRRYRRRWWREIRGCFAFI